ncbi:MAG: ankyrin repeat domain-containing protein [Verrucomicrobiota bacterium]
MIWMGASKLRAADEPVRFIPATPENTTLVDGSSVNTKEGEGDWKWLTNEGNHGIFESYGDPRKNAPPLVLMVNDLKAGGDYEVFGYFWAPGFGDPKDTQGKKVEPQHWPARFGLGLATLTTYGGIFSPRIPWIVSPGAKTSAALGVSATVEESAPLGIAGPPLSTASGDLRLIRALVGIARADATGRLPVFMDDFPDSIHCGRTRIDGVGLRPAPAGSKPSAGAGDSKALHFALRAGDHVSVERELAAGADVNALDAQGIAPLFHPACVGDQKGVRFLLSKGANPNRKGQAISVLTAAATVGDAAMVRLLIEAGAEIPSGKFESIPRNYRRIDESHLHPAIAAIRAGSLATLKVLLEKNPDLDLESIEPLQDHNMGNRPTSRYLVEDAMAMGHDELAAFLIDRGCALQTNQFLYGSKQAHSGLIVRSITEGESLSRSRAALIRRGVPLVFPDYSSYKQREMIPWDALSAAVTVSNRSLAADFLLKVDRTDHRYGESLMALALWAGDPEILRMVKTAFPNVDTRLDPENSPEEKIHDEAELRLLLPRVVPARNQKKEDQQDWTLAVIPSAEVEGQAAFLETTASKETGWKVVDRQEVKAALGEARFVNPWGKGEHRLADLGDRVAADLLILVSQLNGPKMHLLRFEAVDVATGLPVFREHIEREAFKPESAVAPLLARMRAAFAKARAGERPKAVTMLPFTAGSDLPNPASMSRLFSAAIHAEVDATPGVLAVGKNQFQTIADEQKLGGQDGLWAAAYTLEGGLAKAEEGKVSLTLRLTPLAGGKERAIDVTENGNTDQIAVLATRAWQKLAVSHLLGVDRSNIIRPDARQSATEAARLLREGEWLMNSGAAAEALSLFERAGLLGADPRQLVGCHLEALAKSIPMFDHGISLASPSMVIRDHPPSLTYQKKICQSLDAARALLDQGSYYLSIYGPASFKWTGPGFQRSERGDFLHAITILSYIRTLIPKILPSETSAESVRMFGEDLDRFTADYFSIRAKMDQPTMAPLWGDLFNRGPGSAAMLRRNPELLKGWVTMFFLSQSTFPQLFGDNGSGISRWYGMTRLLAEAVDRHLDEFGGNDLAYRKAELAFVFATDERKSNAAREISVMMAGLGRQERFRLGAWISNHSLERHLPSALQDLSRSDVFHDEAIIPAQVHEPRESMDWMRYPGYSNITTLLKLENMNLSESNNYLKINNPSDDYLQRAASLSKEQDGWAKIERLLGGALLWERMYGRPLHDGLSSQLRKLYQPDPNITKKPLNARLLTDLRQIDSSLPGIFMRPTIDGTNRNRMWLYYQPYETEPYMEKNGSYSFPIPRRRQPWLVGIDCAGGKLAPIVNLTQTPALGSGEKVVSTMGGYRQEIGSIAQTPDLIFTDVVWPKDKSDKNSMTKAAVLIRKSDGQMIPLDQPVLVGTPEDVVNSMDKSSGAFSIGDDFFAMHQVGDPNEFYSRKDKIPFQIVRINPTGKVNQVTVHGRRPQLTPFDPADRSPKMIFPDGKRLLVLHNWDHLGRYNPADDTWEMDQRDKAQRYMPVKTLVDADLQSHIFPHHRLEDGSKVGKLVIDSKRTSSEMLLIEGKGAAGRIKVQLEIPENFLRQPIYGDPVLSNGKSGSLVGYGTYETRIKGDTYHLVVLNQTDKDLILALQIGPGLQWYPGTRAGLFLPLLWALPKSELLRTVGNDVNRSQ